MARKESDQEEEEIFDANGIHTPAHVSQALEDWETEVEPGVNTRPDIDPINELSIVEPKPSKKK